MIRSLFQGGSITGGSKKEWKSIRIDDNAFKGIPARVIRCTDGDLRRWFF